ncbi:MAG: ATP-binding protein [Clostridiales bacterium]|nr:ATP-binding protein [Clostridiales bacterium]
MKKKLNLKFMMIAAIAIVVFSVCSMLVFSNILAEQIFDDLKADAHVISAMNREHLSQTIDYDIGEDGLRITLIDLEGNVLYDNGKDEAKMENHKNRPEMKEALAFGEGRELRKSETLSKHMFYYAMQTEEGTILRVGKESASIYRFLSHMIGLILIAGTAIFGVCMFFSKKMTERLLEPIEKMAENIALVDEAEVYEEIRPFVSTIKQQHMDILAHARMRQEFTANVSHELKTPLTAISGYADLIANGMTNETDTQYFASEIHHSAERLQTLINDIIKLSELDDESLKLEFEPIDLFELGKSCIGAMELQAFKNEVSLRIEGESVTVNGNKTLMEELFYNLCSNAIRYNKKGGQVVLFTGIEEGRPILRVRDTGIGIPRDQQERVFERFYRVDKSRSKLTGGTGLGLAIVKHIVAQHNAQLTLSSEEGIGTEIRVMF